MTRHTAGRLETEGPSHWFSDVWHIGADVEDAGHGVRMYGGFRPLDLFRDHSMTSAIE